MRRSAYSQPRRVRARARSKQGFDSALIFVQWQLFLVKANAFIKDLPDTLDNLVWGCRVKAITWWTGKSEADVAWRLLFQDPGRGREPPKESR